MMARRRWTRQRKPKHHHHLLIAASVLLTYGVFSQPGTAAFIAGLGAYVYLGAFISGLFFTTFATTIPAIAAFLLIAVTVNPLLAAALGGLGATVGDFILYKVIRDSFSHDLLHFFRDIEERVHHRFRSTWWHHLVPVVAGFIIASPLPDELAITLLGISRFDPRKFAVFSFLMNTAGILVILLVGQAL